MPNPDFYLLNPAPKIALAPMEGVVDAGVRRLISEIGGIDFCVTEFLRVTSELQPDHTFFKICPELAHQCTTRNAIPVHFQLLGSNPALLAEHAKKASELGAKVVDLNFGCPAKTVNRHKGGAVLLQTPDLVHQIVKTCAEALGGTGTHLTAKMRLGYEDKSLAFENMDAISSGGAESLVVHARTKVEGYKPPAHWEWLARLREAGSIPVTANGEVWSLADYDKCREVSGCKDVMLGRGLLADPYLARRIIERSAELPTEADLAAALFIYLERVRQQGFPDKFLLARGKQWLGMMKKGLVPVDSLFDQLKVFTEAAPMMQLLAKKMEDTRNYTHYLPAI